MVLCRDLSCASGDLLCFNTRFRWEIDSDAGLGEVYCTESDEESKGGYDLEVDNRLETNAAYLLEASGSGNTDDQCREDERRDNDLDEAQENAAQDKNPCDYLSLCIGVLDEAVDHEPNQNAESESDEDLRGQRETDSSSHSRVSNSLSGPPADDEVTFPPRGTICRQKTSPKCSAMLLATTSTGISWPRSFSSEVTPRSVMPHGTINRK